jgi:tetratricopeptide (TPR) repeat protein
LDDDEDLQVLLLRSIIAAGDGDAREARRMLNRAVELYPSDPTTFFRRAALNSSDPALFTDAIQDLDKAVELRPDYVEAWTLRFSLYRREGQMDEAFTQLRRAVDANPQNDEMKQFLLTELRRNGREGEAQAFAVQVADDKGEDREWLRLAAVLSYDNGAYNEAERLFRKIYDLEPDPLSASDLLNVILRKDVKPTRAEVNRTLAIVKESDRRTVGMLMLQARAHEFLEEPGPAETLTLEAYQEASASSILARHWFDNLLLRFDGDLDRTFAYLRGTDELGTLPPVLRVMMIRRDTQDGVSVEDCLANLEALKPEAQGDAFTMIELLRLENQLNYTLGNYEACVAACRMGLQIAPRDLELNNNLAYTLAKHLNDPEAAKPFAERAAQIAPLNPAVLDTLGWVYYETGQYRDADRVLDRALQTSKTPDNRVPAYLHLAMCKRAIGDEPEARRLIGLARTEVTGASQAIQDQYTEEIEALYAELN